MISRTQEQRRRKRTVSTLDSNGKTAARSLEARVKLLLMGFLGLVLRPQKKQFPLSASDVRAVLILRYDALGDAILSTPVWRAIKRASPNIHIGVAGSERNISFLQEDESLDSTYLFSRGFSFALLRELKKARKVKWDVVLNLYFHDKTRGAIFATYAAPDAVSVTLVRDHAEEYEKIYSAIGMRPKELTPITLQNIEAARIAIALPSNLDTRPILPASFMGESFRSSNPYIVLHTEASQDYKEWGLDHCQAWTKLAIERTAFDVLWTSSPSRAQACIENVSALRSDRAQYCPTPTLEALSQTIAGALAVVTPDTSVVHLASAHRVPIVGLYLEPNEFLPYGGPSRVLFAPDGKHVSKIGAEHVFSALQEMIEAQ